PRLGLDARLAGLDGTDLGRRVVLGIVHALIGEVHLPDDQPEALVAAEADAALPVLVGLPAQRHGNLDPDRLEPDPGEAAIRIHAEDAGLGWNGSAADPRIYAVEAGSAVGHRKVPESHATSVKIAIGTS